MTRLLRTGLLALVLAWAGAAPAGRADAVPDLRRVEVTVVRPPASRAERSQPVPLGVRAVRLARRFVGVPYAYGGASPAGFDCSGLVHYVYGRLGLAVPHNAAALYGEGRSVPISALQPGDLVFFSGLGHVGMAVGGGRYIHAPQSGELVEEASLAERAGSIVGARRLHA